MKTLLVVMVIIFILVGILGGVSTHDRKTVMDCFGKPPARLTLAVCGFAAMLLVLVAYLAWSAKPV
jgi:hypothetical protein